uniref:Peptidase A1 domain-containing protein n=1 Tax=Acrobeloides nanus TaxID=290746 RepID=A0A914EGK9_9BILA
MLRFVIIIFLFEFALSANYKVYVNTSSPVRTVSDKFLSVTLDTGSSKTNFSGLNFSFITPLAKALSPAYLRFGGSDADNLIFQENLTLSNEFEFYG